MNEQPTPTEIVDNPPVIKHTSDARKFVLEISDGWTIDQIKTEDDCDKAFIHLCSVITTIEYQLEMQVIDPNSHVRHQDITWPPRARSALRLKKTALQAVQNIRKRIQREHTITQDRAILTLLKRDHPNIFADLFDRVSEHSLSKEPT